MVYKTRNELWFNHENKLSGTRKNSTLEYEIKFYLPCSYMWAILKFPNLGLRTTMWCHGKSCCPRCCEFTTIVAWLKPKFQVGVNSNCIVPQRPEERNRTDPRNWTFSRWLILIVIFKCTSSRVWATFFLFFKNLVEGVNRSFICQQHRW